MTVTEASRPKSAPGKTDISMCSSSGGHFRASAAPTPATQCPRQDNFVVLRRA